MPVGLEQRIVEPRVCENQTDRSPMRNCRAARKSASIVTLMALSMCGCASLIGPNESIVRVAAAQDTAKAARLTRLGMRAIEQGDIETASLNFLDAVAADESFGPAHNNLGLLHYDAGNLYQAVLAFETAMELMPHDPTVFYNLGLTLEAAGKVHEAMDLYWQAVEMEPENPIFLGNLVRLRVRLGESGPELTTQLQDLVLIETRPDWRRWADRQLALDQNPLLDRGPDPPDLGSSTKNEQETVPATNDSIIDLTPDSP